MSKLAQENEVAEVDMIGANIVDSFVSNCRDNRLWTCLTDFALSFDVDSAVEEVNTFLDSAPIMNITK